MDFSLNEEQKQIKALVREFCEREIDQKRMREILRKNDAAKTIEEIKRNYPYDIKEKAHKAGLLTIGIPTKYGGPGPDTGRYTALAVALEEGAYSGGLISAEFPPLIIGPSFGNLAVASSPYLTEKQKEEIFSRLLKYTRRESAGSYTEPAGSTDIHLGYDDGGDQILQVTARKDGAEWIINGDKMFCSNGTVADEVVVLARTRKGPISESASQFRVPISTPGVSRTLNKFMYTGFSGNVQFHYDNVRVPESAIICKMHEGWKNMSYSFQHKFLGHCYHGLLLRLYDHMREYAKQRIGGGKPLIQHTSCAEKLGDLALHLEATKLLWYKCAWESDQWDKAGAPVPPARERYWDAAFTVSVKESCYRFFELAHEIYGSIVSSEDLPLESFFRWVYTVRAASLPINIGKMKLCSDYDTREYYIQ